MSSDFVILVNPQHLLLSGRLPRVDA
jgi:hypothetical protein